MAQAMYYLRRVLAQIIDALLLGAVIFIGTDDSPIEQQGKWHTFKPSPMYPTAGVTEFSITLSEYAKEAPPEEARPAGYQLFQFQLFDGMEITLTHYPQIGWPLVLIYALYYTVCTGRWGQTVGKWAMRLKVVTIYDQPVSYRRATGRWLAYYLSGMPLYLGLVWIFVNRQNQGWHDLICKTSVVSIAKEGASR